MPQLFVANLRNSWLLRAVRASIWSIWHLNLKCPEYLEVPYTRHMQAPNQPETTLLFVYNADTGLFNTMADIGHKIFSPQTYACDLCMLTHGYFSERSEWREFIEGLGVATRFLHRNEFQQEFPKLDVPLPAVFLQQAGATRLCINARSLHDCKDLAALKNLITLACEPAAD